VVRKAPFEGEVQPLGEGAWSVSPGEGWATPGDQVSIEPTRASLALLAGKPVVGQAVVQEFQP